MMYCVIYPIGIRGVNYIAIAVIPSWALRIAYCILHIPDPESVEICFQIMPILQKKETDAEEVIVCSGGDLRAEPLSNSKQ